jgi:hypothetical protein
MAAVGIAKEDFRARRLDTRLWEVPLAVVRYFGSSEPVGGSAHSAAAQLVELKPGFSEPLPLDASILHETSRAGVTGDTFLGPGKHGGTLRLRPLGRRCGGIRWTQSVNSTPGHPRCSVCCSDTSGRPVEPLCTTSSHERVFCPRQRKGRRCSCPVDRRDTRLLDARP